MQLEFVKKARLLIFMVLCALLPAGCETTNLPPSGLPSGYQATEDNANEPIDLAWKPVNLGMSIQPAEWIYPEPTAYDPSDDSRQQLFFGELVDEGYRLEIYGSRIGIGRGLNMDAIDTAFREEAKGSGATILDHEVRTICGIPWHYYVVEDTFNDKKVFNIHFETFHQGVYLDAIFWDWGTAEKRVPMENKLAGIFGNLKILDGNSIFWGSGNEPVTSFESEHFGVTYEGGGKPFVVFDLQRTDDAYFDGVFLLGDPQAIVRVIPFVGDVEKLRWNALLDATSAYTGFDSASIPLSDRTEMESLPFDALEINFPRAERKGASCWLVKSPEAAFVFTYLPLGRLPENKPLESFLWGVKWPTGLGDKPKEEFPEWAQVAHGTMYASLGLHYTQLGNLTKAEEYSLEALEWYASSLEAVYTLTHLYQQMGRPAEAIPHIENILGDQEENHELKRLLGLSYYLSGDPDTGGNLYRELLATGSIPEFWVSEHFSQLRQAGRFEEMNADLETFAHLDLDVLDFWKGMALIGLNNREDGVVAIDRYIEKHPQEADAYLAKVNALLEAQFPAEALQAAETGYGETGNVDLLYLQGVASHNLGYYEDARRQFQSCLSVNPSHAPAQQFLSVVTSLLGETDRSLFETPIASLPLPEGVIEKAPPFEKSAYAGKGAVSEWQGMVIAYEPGVIAKKTLYKKFHVLNENGLSQLKESTINFNPLNERVYINRLVVFDREGKQVGEGNLGQYYISDRGDDVIVNEEKTLHIPIPGLEVGGSFELILTVEILGQKDVYPFEAVNLAGLFPHHNAFLSLRGNPSDFQYTTGSHTIDQVVLENEIVWVSHNPPVYERKDYLPYYTLSLPTIWISSATGKSWKDLAVKYAEELSEYLEADEEAAGIAASLQVENAPDREKIEAVADYLATHFEYKALNFGYRASIPHPVGEIVTNRFGDCKDLSLLAVQLLRALGLKADLGLVDTMLDLVKDIQTIYQFNHMIVIVDLPEGPVLYDPADKYMPSLQTPRTVAGNPVLRISKDPQNLWIDASDPVAENNSIQLVREISPSEGDYLNVSETGTFTGLFAASLRENFARVPDQDQRFALQSYLAASGNRINIETLDIENLSEIQEPLRMTYLYKVRRPGFHEEGPAQVELPTSWEATFLPVINRDEDRIEDVYLHMPLHLTATTTLVFPQALKGITELSPKKTRMSNQMGSFNRSVSISSNRVTARYEASLTSGMFPPDAMMDLTRLSESGLEAAQFKLLIPGIE